MDESIPERYARNPMLVLVENYILDTLGELDRAKVEQLDQIVCRTFGGSDWRAIIREQFHLPHDTDTTLQKLWKQRQEQADASQQGLTPEDFARAAADEFFQNMGN